MQTTERKHWVNGFDRRGAFWTYAFTVGRFGVLVCRPFYNNPTLNLYRLI